jgi:two-component system, cell cycle sensor histidine kinase and response regulator CckA
MSIVGEPQILVVDDEAAIRTLIAGAFADECINVTTAENRSDAIAIVSKYEFDVVVVDKRLPDGSGLDVIDAVKRRSDHCQAIVITAYSDTDSAIQAVSMGAFRYILKPFDLKALKNDILQALETSRLRRDLDRRTQELTKTNKALVEREAKYRSLFNSGIDAIVVYHLDKAGKPLQFLEVNDIACTLLGYSKEELQQCSIVDIIEKDDEAADASPLADQMRNLLAEKVSLFEIDAVKKNGNRIPVEVSSRLFEFSGSQTVFTVIRDIADRRASEEERARLEIQVREAQKMEAIGRLAGGVAHDMNNVLGAIMGFASALEAEMETSSKWYKDVSEVLKACRKGRDLTRDLLGFARKGKYVLENVSFNELVKDVVSILNRLASKKVEFITEMAPNLEPIQGDFGQLNHALMNICLNAVDAVEAREGGRGTVFIRTQTENLDINDMEEYQDIRPGRYSIIEVRDNGIGMNTETMQHAFEPFYTTKPQGKGTGLGLAMVYGTVKNHSGSIKLSSTRGKGTIVKICIPVAKPTDATPITKGIPSRPIKVRNGTVLLVDDEPMVRNSGKRLLDRLGYRVLLARNGEEALTTYQDNKNDIWLVVLDLIMPVMDGEETFIKLKEIDPGVRVLLSSGYSKEEKADSLLTMGAAGFLQKPFDLKALVKELDRIQPANPKIPENLTVA